MPTQTKYPIWKNDPAFKCSRANLINYASEFRQSYSHYISRYTFDHLRPLVTDIEEIAIKPAIGETLYNNLLNEIKDGRIGINGCVPEIIDRTYSLIFDECEVVFDTRQKPPSVKHSVYLQVKNKMSV